MAEIVLSGCSQADMRGTPIPHFQVIRLPRSVIAPGHGILLAFDFGPGVKHGAAPAPPRAGIGRASSGRTSWGDLPCPFEPIERGLGPAVAAVWALYEGTFKDACVMDWTLEQAVIELVARLQMISLGHDKRGRGRSSLLFHVCGGMRHVSPRFLSMRTRMPSGLRTR